MTTVAKGRCTSAPAEAETAIGKKPKISVEAVKNIGRNRRTAPFLMRSSIVSSPFCFSSLKLLINTKPFKTATPNKTIKPTPAEILKGISLKYKAKIPPTAAKGTAK